MSDSGAIAGGHGDHVPRAAPRGEPVEEGRLRGLERGAPVELRDGVVAQPVEAHVQESAHGAES